MKNELLILNRFSINALLVATTTLAVTFGVFPYLPVCRHPFLFSVIGIWSGLIILALSDSIDSRQIENRNIGSQTLNLTGFVVLLLSSLTFTFCLATNGVVTLIVATKMFTD